VATAQIDPELTANLSPPRIVEAASGTLAGFRDEFGDTQFLLVKLQEAHDQLQAGLGAIEKAAVQKVQPSIRAMGFETAMMSTNDLGAVLESAASRGLVRLERLRWLLRNDPYFAMPLRKRTDDATFMDRISVGRAVNKDVVLRHPNISKLHAWFELDGAGNVYAADAGSTNGTYHNGERLPPRELTKVHPGDHMRFGSVECITSTADDLWRALRAG